MPLSIKTVSELLKNNYQIFRAFTENNNYSDKFKNFKKFKTIIIVGMGGSILGSKAIYSFLKYKINKKLIFIDNLDENLIKKIRNENNLSKGLFIIISKSGNTSETILNLYFFKSYLKKNNTIILTENKNNFLKNFALKKNFKFIEHKKFIGGRYSVLTDVGMLPAFLMGLKNSNFKKDLRKLLHNKSIFLKSFKNIKKLNLSKTKTLIFFNYVPELQDFLYWCQQLFAESLGKKNRGFLPVISNAPKDHHSLLQLYLAGPKDKVFYIFSKRKTKSIRIKSSFFEKNMSYLNNKKYNNVVLSQKNAFIEVLKLKKIPYREILIDELDENTLGKLFLQFIFETIFIAKIMKINPFDQPAVEDVKILTKKILNSKKS